MTPIDYLVFVSMIIFLLVCYIAGEVGKKHD